MIAVVVRIGNGLNSKKPPPVPIFVVCERKAAPGLFLWQCPCQVAHHRFIVAVPNEQDVKCPEQLQQEKPGISVRKVRLAKILVRKHHAPWVQHIPVNMDYSFEPSPQRSAGAL